MNPVLALAPRGGLADGWRVTDDEVPAPNRSRRIAIFLWLLPLWLVLSSGLGMWLHYRGKAAAEQVEQARFVTTVNEEGLRDDMGKLLGFVGERHTSGAAGIQGLNRAAAMIEGSLGPANAGYRIEKFHGPETEGSSWPVIMATARGSDEKAAPLWVLAAYDARPGTPGAEANASGVASVLAAAHALANATPKRSIHFAFVPHAYDADSPLTEMQERLAKQIGTATTVLVVEATGAADKLMISSRDARNAVFTQAAGLGEVVGAEAICLEDDFDLSAVLFELGVPTVRVSTRPVVKTDEPDATAPDPKIHAAATRSLVRLIERLSGT